MFVGQSKRVKLAHAGMFLSIDVWINLTLDEMSLIQYVTM
jgi:hypothetical protein